MPILKTPKKSRRKRDSNLGSSALEAYALTTRPTRRSTYHVHSTLIYYNMYSLKLLLLTLYQYNIHQKRITIIYIKIFTTAISMAKKKKNLCLPKRLVTSLQMSMRTGRTVALKITYLKGRDDTRTQNDISLATSSSSHQTPALTAKVDDHPENQPRQPSMNDLTLYERSTGSIISSSPPPRHMTMHMHPPRAFNIQYSNIDDLKLTTQTLRLKPYTILTMHRYPPRAFYTHYYNILQSQTSASNVIPI